MSFCYDDEISANAWDSRRADDPNTWRYLAGHLQITTDDQFTWGVLLSRNGSALPEDPFPDEAMTGWEDVANGHLDEVSPWVVARGSSSEAPQVPDDLVPIMGG